MKTGGSTKGKSLVYKTTGSSQRLGALSPWPHCLIDLSWKSGPKVAASSGHCRLPLNSVIQGGSRNRGLCISTEKWKMIGKKMETQKKEYAEFQTTGLVLVLPSPPTSLHHLLMLFPSCHCWLWTSVLSVSPRGQWSMMVSSLPPHSPIAFGCLMTKKKSDLHRDSPSGGL